MTYAGVRPFTVRERLGNALIAARAARHQSRKRLAEDNGLHPNTLREVELGQANPTIDRLEALAAIYGVELTITVTPRKDHRT